MEQAASAKKPAKQPAELDDDDSNSIVCPSIESTAIKSAGSVRSKKVETMGVEQLFAQASFDIEAREVARVRQEEARARQEEARTRREEAREEARVRREEAREERMTAEHKAMMGAFLEAIKLLAHK